MKQKFSLLATLLFQMFGFYSSADSQWTHTNSPTHVACLCVSGANTSTPVLFMGTADSGVFISTDNGTSWQARNSGLPNDTVSAIVVSVGNLFVGTHSGVFRSTNNGTSWMPANTGIPADFFVGQFCVVGSNTSPPTLIASAGDLNAKAGVYRSTDNGANWVEADAGIPSNAFIADFTVTGTNTPSPKLFAGCAFSVPPLYSSTNEGTTWSKSDNGEPYTVNSLAVIDTNAPSPILFTDGIFRSTDNGASWTEARNGLPLRAGITNFAVSGKNIFASSAVNGVFLSTDSGISWRAVNTGLKDTFVIDLAVTGSYLFAGTSIAGSFTGDVWRRPLSEMTTMAGYASDTQSVPLSNTGKINVTISGDSANYRAHRIDFVNNTSNSLIISNATLMTSDLRFLISHISPSVPDTVKPGGTFSMIVSFLGDISGTVYQDTLVLTIGDPTSFYVYLTGNSFASPKGDVSNNSPAAVASPNSRIYPNPFSQSTQITFTPEASGFADVSIFNQLGVEVARLFSGELDAAEEHTFTWNNPSALPDGAYECLIRINGQVEKLPVVLIR